MELEKAVAGEGTRDTFPATEGVVQGSEDLGSSKAGQVSEVPDGLYPVI